jgi:hypothetical protein
MNARAGMRSLSGVVALVLLVAAIGGSADAQTPATAQAAAPVVLDSVVAVVNRHAILSSDIDEEIQLSVLDPSGDEREGLTRRRALDQLISRALIEQQIRREDEQASTPSETEVAARLDQIRKQLPFCVRRNCVSDEAWKQVLVERGLTPERVTHYLRYRLQILAFIELRFRQGIRIAPEEISEYYTKALAPQYKPGDPVPPLEAVSKRIEEILLEQRVNLLFDDWLTNLRKQGDVEVLDPALEDAAEQTPAAGRKGAGA